MKQILSIAVLSMIFSQTVFAQKRASIVHVDNGKNQIKNEPYIILPQTAVKLNFSVVEFKYSMGDKLKDLIKITDNSCKDEAIKKELKILEKKYDVNLDAIIGLLRLHNSGKSDEDFITYKLDKDIKTSFISVADYTKVFKYTGLKKSPLNSSLLNLEYDENGILLTSKQTNESKLLPTIFSALSGIVSVTSALSKSESDAPAAAAYNDITGTCTKIQIKETKDMDDLMRNYTTFLKTASILTDKQFDKAKEKTEEEITKEFSDLFYSKVVRVIPVEIIFIIPQKENPTIDNSKAFDLFSYDKTKQKILLDKKYKTDLIFTPSDRFEFSDKLTSPHVLRVSTVEKLFDKSESMSSLMGKEIPEKITAVYNIPKSERIRLEKPSGTEAISDTTVKVPQHGSLGYFSLRLSALELTYNIYGELKKISAEKKSAVDSNVTTGATVGKEIIGLFKGQSKFEELKEKADLLEQEKKIRDLEKELQQ